MGGFGSDAVTSKTVQGIHSIPYFSLQSVSELRKKKKKKTPER